MGLLLVRAARPLPKELADFLDQGQPLGHAAVYVSMETLVKLPQKDLISMAAALAALPNPILWQLDPVSLPGQALSQPEWNLLVCTRDAVISQVVVGNPRELPKQTVEALRSLKHVSIICTCNSEPEPCDRACLLDASRHDHTQ